MRIHILETGRLSNGLDARHGTYPSMFQRLLVGQLPEAEFGVCRLCEGEPLPSLAELDAVLITGSPHGVNDDLPWIPALLEFLRTTRRAKVPVAGICFGHQAMAAAYGGKVEKASNGWNVGRLEYRIVDPATDFANETGKFAALSFHQDQVTRPPPDAHIFLSHETSPYAGLFYDFPAISVQFHPEFTVALMRDLLAQHGGQKVPQEVADAALRGLDGDVDDLPLAMALARFFRRHQSACP